jgi:hydroxypyruvate reductase
MPIAKELGLSRTIQDAATRAVGLQQQVSSSVRNVVIGNNASAVNGAAEKARALGYVTSVTDDFPGGDATEVGEALARRGLELLSAGEKRCLVSGGEPTVRGVQPGGHGGRSTHLALAAGQILQDRAGILLASVGTDGEDGPTDAAGAMFFSPVAMRARELGLDPAGYLLRTDSYRFFSEAGGLIETGLTGTNVADLRIVITDGESGRSSIVPWNS